MELKGAACVPTYPLLQVSHSSICSRPSAAPHCTHASSSISQASSFHSGSVSVWAMLDEGCAAADEDDEDEDDEDDEDNEDVFV